LNPLQGLREFISYPSIVERTSLYWGYLNPSFLFLDATASAMFSTRTTGVFLPSLGFFCLVGVYQAIRSKDLKNTVVILGLLTAPLAAVLVLEVSALNRALELLPFGVLLAVVGVVHLWSTPLLARIRIVCLAVGVAGLATGIGYAAWTLLTSGHISRTTPVLILLSAALAAIYYAPPRIANRIVVLAVLATVPVEFWQFQRDYFTDYRARASESFRGNRREALEYIIEQTRLQNVPAIYFSSDIKVIEPYWRLYLIKHRREELFARTVIYGGSSSLDPHRMPANSIVMVKAGDPTASALEKAGQLTLETLVREPGGQPSFAIFRR
jgi:hypothetical protein